LVTSTADLGTHVVVEGVVDDKEKLAQTGNGVSNLRRKILAAFRSG
jgi:hypothetical protein